LWNFTCSFGPCWAHKVMASVPRREVALILLALFVCKVCGIKDLLSKLCYNNNKNL
jgi:hypothetical protein